MFGFWPRTGATLQMVWFGRGKEQTGPSRPGDFCLSGQNARNVTLLHTLSWESDGICAPEPSRIPPNSSKCDKAGHEECERWNEGFPPAWARTSLAWYSDETKQDELCIYRPALPYRGSRPGSKIPAPTPNGAARSTKCGAMLEPFWRG